MFLRFSIFLSLKENKEKTHKPCLEQGHVISLGEEYKSNTLPHTFNIPALRGN